jgi:lipid-A-disaccharide synthase-like uncharacterized protein
MFAIIRCRIFCVRFAIQILKIEKYKTIILAVFFMDVKLIAYIEGGTLVEGV